LELLDPQVQKVRTTNKTKMRDLFKFHEKMSAELISWFKNNVEKTTYQDKDLLEITNVSNKVET
jgi:hypothetical protein